MAIYYIITGGYECYVETMDGCISCAYLTSTRRKFKAGARNIASRLGQNGVEGPAAFDGGGAALFGES